MPTTGVFNGNLLLIYNDDVAIGCITGCSVDLSRAMIDASCKDNSGRYEALPGQLTMTGSVDGLAAFDATEGIDEILDDILNGTSVTVKMSTEVTGDTYIEADAYFENVTIDGPLNDVASFSAGIHFYGAITKAAVS